MNPLRTALLTSALLGWGVGPAAAQAVLTQIEGTAGQGLGASIATGDFDGDGGDDVLFGAPRATVDVVESGAAFLHSGKTGALLWAWDPDLASAHAGESVAGIGDIDGDGISTSRSASRGRTSGTRTPGGSTSDRGRTGRWSAACSAAPPTTGSARRSPTRATSTVMGPAT